MPKNVPLGQLLAARASGLPSATAFLSHQKQSQAVAAHRAAKRLAKEAKRKARKEDAEKDAAADNKNAKNGSSEKEETEAEREARRLRRRNRENKNRPTEAPSNRQPPKLREVIAPVVPRAREADGSAAASAQGTHGKGPTRRPSSP